MSRIPLLAALLLSSAACFAAPARMDKLVIHHPDTHGIHGCTPDKLCVEIAPAEAGCEGPACGENLSLTLSGGRAGQAHASYPLADLAGENEPASFDVWPQLIRFEGGILAGVERHSQTMYSGGGASATSLHLIAFLPDQPPLLVLSVPLSANVMIRACFSERDMDQRGGACHDEYSFDARLTLTGRFASGLPVLRYRSKATSFPGPASRSRDSLANPPLRKRDIVTVTDPQCSYQRLYRFASQARAYVPDTPAPDCTDYTVP